MSLGRPRDVSEGRPQDVGRIRPLELKIRSYGHVLATSVGDDSRGRPLALHIGYMGTTSGCYIGTSSGLHTLTPKRRRWRTCSGRQQGTSLSIR